ncbi:GGDEF domain-containing protein [Mycobacterium sp. CVI_P3]|uniref:GGDEF domain-containing protein n=1 Tax=Mycobacterium pinniadriaticum TaxID=2994102 RepID=A0ABT3SND7_9MYCO|nr:GGDEF domain-containing protein [Mycobacterium pinniadriaticum]MCX2934616.1 GGDEF domain-containing protein [Mycobacterium pinniadriaticum]MCX2941039.1 GGDEF domain-containing protein [Mycobacterium pinniadriaticum]
MSTSSLLRWLRADQYDWLTGYLATRGLIGHARALMTVITAVPTLCVIVMQISKDGPTGVASTFTWLAAAIGVGSTLLWIWRWPTRTQFRIFALSACSGLAVVSVLVPAPQAGLIYTYGLMIAGAFLALFQNITLMLYNFALVVCVAAVQSARLAAAGHPSLSVAMLGLVVLANIVVPLAIYIMGRALAGDLLQAEHDPLTGLYNRRAFLSKTIGMLMSRTDTDSEVVVALIDLDKFKHINDRYGHDAGDRALVHVARALLKAAGSRAIVSRSGGEEFLVLTTAPPDDPSALARQICDAISTCPAHVTASVGTATAPLDGSGEAEHEDFVRDLISAADTAMYKAKRSGGNQVRHYEPQEPGSPT